MSIKKNGVFWWESVYIRFYDGYSRPGVGFVYKGFFFYIDMICMRFVLNEIHIHLICTSIPYRLPERW
jgi:hypothetical protein